MLKTKVLFCHHICEKAKKANKKKLHKPSTAPSPHRQCTFPGTNGQNETQIIPNKSEWEKHMYTLTLSLRSSFLQILQ